LAKPSQQFPNTLGKIWLFQRYPYSLPCLVAGGYVGFVMILCSFFLKEVSPVDRPFTEFTGLICSPTWHPISPRTRSETSPKR
jgi:hypothetical protein